MRLRRVSRGEGDRGQGSGWGGCCAWDSEDDMGRGHQGQLEAEDAEEPLDPPEGKTRK